MKVHFIAIGGSAMHNMAIALHKKGYKVTGSDDEILEPSKGRLARHGLLPQEIGWFENKITADLDAIILGMHARKDNPELIKAQQLGLKIYSYPDYIYEQTKNKTRVVIGGSHGKTTITSMILHVLRYHRIDCDFLVGAQLENFDTMVNLDDNNKIAVIEGDEYLSSPIDLRPKFHVYKPDIALISGIAWDHINVFPTFDNYVKQFGIFINEITPNGSLIYCQNDEEVVKVVNSKGRNDIKKTGYTVPPHIIEAGVTYLISNEQRVPLKIFGEHNLMNLEGARNVCNDLGISNEKFYEAISSFKGAAKRLELVMANEDTVVLKDFAHSPSKLKATTNAVKNQYPDKRLIACMELHTFSSLNENFLKEYDGSMSLADEAIIYFNPHTIAHKKLKPITEQQVKEAFNSSNVKVFTDNEKMVNYLKGQNWKNSNLLLMSSGNFGGLNFTELAEELINKD